MQNISFIWRRFKKQKANTISHIVGLTLGMSVCFLIGLFIRYELSFDGYENKADRIYRINTIWTNGGKKDYDFSTPLPLARVLRKEATGVERVVLAHPQDNILIEVNPEKRFIQDHILITDSGFLDLFNIDVIRGNGPEALSTPFKALLTEETANKFFGNEDPIGKTFRYADSFLITVAGVIRNLPSNTHLPVSMLVSYVRNERFLTSPPNSWYMLAGTSTFVLLPKDQNTVGLDKQLKAIADKFMNNEPGSSLQDRADFDIQPLRKIHFDSKYRGGGPWVSAMNTEWLWFFGGIGLAVLALACINFVNLSTAQALTRAKEVGVRKSLGAGKFNLVFQFLAEAWVLALISGVLSFLIALLFLPSMNNLLEKDISYRFLLSPGFLVTLVAIIFVAGLLAGLYPAWVIANFNAAVTLKTGGTATGQKSSSWLRKGLVVMQFTISVGLLISVLIIAQQVRYMHNKSLGFDKDNIVNVNLKEAGKTKLFAEGLNGIRQVSDFSFGSAAPSSAKHSGTLVSMTNRNDPNKQHVKLILGDDHYCSMYGLKLLSGRMLKVSDTNFASNSIPAEQRIYKVVVNEKLLQALNLGLPKDVIGKRFWCGMGGGNAAIIGVVADFNTTSLRDAIGPVLIVQDPDSYRQAGIKIRAGSNLPQTLGEIGSAWKLAFPEGVFEYKFLDEQIDSFYKSEARLYALFRIFAVLALIISCLGLWGLAYYSSQQRTKEIGIRKVLGASTPTLVKLLSMDFLKMVAMAFLIASPIAWYFMDKWLQDYSFRITISPWVFVIVGCSAVLIALFTVSFQAIRSASANPVDSIRTE